VSDYGVAEYGWMMRDRRRLDAYHQALKRAIEARGGGVVCELGTGTGIKAFLAVQAGARKVYAVEPNDAIELARQIARDNDVGDDKIEWLHAFSQDVELPEKADILISDMRGPLPFCDGHFEAIADARARLLKPDGILIAQRDRVFAALATGEDIWRRVVAHWDENAAGLDMSEARKISANHGLRWEAKAEDLLTEPVELGAVEFATVDTPSFEGRARVAVAKAGRAHAIPVWFDTELDDETTLSNAPGQPVLAYGRVAFPLEQPVDVEPGDVMALTFRAELVRGHYIWIWHTRIESASGELKANFKQSTFYGEAISIDTLKGTTPDAVPELNESGRAHAFLYSHVDGKRSQGDLARELHAAFPAKFADEQEALTWVVRALEGVRK
jgi:protein arginine N-methyltransferase 1